MRGFGGLGEKLREMGLLGFQGRGRRRSVTRGFERVLAEIDIFGGDGEGHSSGLRYLDTFSGFIRLSTSFMFFRLLSKKRAR